MARAIVGGARANRGDLRAPSICASHDDRGALGTGRTETQCPHLRRTLATGAVVLSLALDSEALFKNERESVVVASGELSASPGTSASAQHGDTETPTLHRREERAAPIQTSDDEPLDTSLRIVTMTESGTLPRTALGVGLMAGAHSGPYRVSVRLMQWAEQVQFVGTTGDRGGSFDLLSGSLHLCRKWPGRRDRPHGCGVLGTVGRLSATGIAETRTRPVNLLASVGGSALLRSAAGPERSHAEVSAPTDPARTIRSRSSESSRRQSHGDSGPSARGVGRRRLGASWGLSF